MTEQLFQQYWPYLMSAAGGIVWLIRLEGKVKQVEKTQTTEGTRLVAAMEKMGEKQDKMAEMMSEMRTTLAGVVGYEKGASEAREVRR